MKFSGVLVGLLLAVAVALLKDETVGRLERLPLFMLRRAARRLPESMREEQMEEWHGNLRDEIYTNSAGLPLTRFGRGFAYAWSALLHARRLARAVDPTAPRNLFVAYLRASYRVGTAAGNRCLDHGQSRFIAHTVGFLIAMHGVDLILIALVAPVQAMVQRPLLAVLQTTAIVAVIAVIQACGRAGSVVLLETGRRRGWPARRIYMTHRVPVDVTYPAYTTIAMFQLLGPSDFTWFTAAMWAGMQPVALGINWYFARDPRRMVVAEPPMIRDASAA